MKINYSYKNYKRTGELKPGECFVDSDDDSTAYLILNKQGYRLHLEDGETPFPVPVVKLENGQLNTFDANAKVRVVQAEINILE